MFTPSWLSAFLCVVLALATTILVAVATTYKSSSLRIDLINYHSSTGVYQAANSKLFTNTFIANLPLIAFWTIVGFVVYLFTINIIRAISSTAELKDELEYVNVDRHSLIWSAVEQLLVHLLVLVVWVGYIVLFVQKILPYCMNLANIGATQISSVSGIFYLIASFAILTIALHVQVVMLRLLLLRPRVFSSAVYVD